MTFIFWQIIISPHQLPFIQELSALSEDNKVTLVVSKRMAERRIKMGWNLKKNNKIDRFDIVVAPSYIKCEEILKKNQTAYHFFSGLRSDPMIFESFKLSLKYPVKRFLIAEGPNFYKKPKILHRLRTFLFDRKYFKHFEKVYAIGNHARQWYPIWGFKPHQIVPFSYCVSKASKVKPITGTIKFVFVGSLIRLKAVDKLLNALSATNQEYYLNIIGSGKELTNLKSIVRKYDMEKMVNFLGSKPNEEVRKILINSDCLILPSSYDGWGAVVNEALMAGLFVICSDQCGASDLIRDKFNGIVFSHQQTNSLTEALNYCIEDINEIRVRKPLIYDWSKKIEGGELAKYMIESLKDQETITPPWYR